jgi:hypothetical protein
MFTYTLLSRLGESWLLLNVCRKLNFCIGKLVFCPETTSHKALREKWENPCAVFFG